MATRIEFELRGNKIKGVVTDDDAFFFCGLFYNFAELKLSKEGREEEAFAMLSDRFAQRLEQAKDEQVENKEIAAELGLKVRREISHNWEIRKNVCWRILECFPGFPDSLVYWHSESRFGIRLDISELVEVFMRIIGVILEQLPQTPEADSPKEIQEAQPAVPATVTTTVKPAVSSEIQQLEQKIANLKLANDYPGLP